LVVLLAIVVASFVYLKNTTKKDIVDLDKSYRVKAMVIRDTIINDSFGTTLGRIIEGDMKNKLVLISSDMTDEFKIGQILSMNSKISKNKYLSNAFDMVFFGRVDYQIDFPKISVVGNTSGLYFIRAITFVRNIMDRKIKEVFGLKNYSLFSM
jgi:hypothetical protein